jgi:hypothetical protein
MTTIAVISDSYTRLTCDSGEPLKKVPDRSPALSNGGDVRGFTSCRGEYA